MPRSKAQSLPVKEISSKLAKDELLRRLQVGMCCFTSDSLCLKYEVWGLLQFAPHDQRRVFIRTHAFGFSLLSVHGAST